MHQEPDADNIQEFIKVLKEHRNKCDWEGNEVEMATNRIPNWNSKIKKEDSKNYFSIKQSKEKNANSLILNITKIQSEMERRAFGHLKRRFSSTWRA